MAESSDSRPVLRQKWWQNFRRGVRASAPFAGGVLAAFAALILYNILFPAPRPLTKNEVNATVAQALASATPPPAFSEQVFQEIEPSLVLIETKSTNASGKTEDGLGSGVVVDQGGDILTALHVVADSSSIQVIFADGSKSSAQITVQQPQNDVAVLQPDQPPALIVPAVLGNPNAMRVGDEAYVVGNPYGLYGSMSAGVISGFNRSFQPTGTNIKLQGLIQIDAAVNPGNSGGPLLNRNGEVIGIIEGIVNPTDQNFFVGIGFAVPINTAAGAAGLPPD
jgi:S1-C subfamily serine protease